MAKELIEVSPYLEEIRKDPELFVNVFNELRNLEQGHGRNSENDKSDYGSRYFPGIEKAIIDREREKIIERKNKEKRDVRLSYFKIYSNITIALLSFLLITFLGIYIQESSFNRNSVFNSNIGRYEQAQDLVTDIMLNIRDASQRINWYKDDSKKVAEFQGFVRVQRNELERLEDVLRTLNTDRREELNKVMLEAFDDIDKFLRGEELLQPDGIVALRREIAISMVGFLASHD